MVSLLVATLRGVPMLRPDSLGLARMDRSHQLADSLKIASPDTKKQKTAARWTVAEEADLEKAVAAQQVDANDNVDWVRIAAEQLELGWPERKATACQERYRKLKAAKKQKEAQGGQGGAAAEGGGQAGAGAAGQREWLCELLRYVRAS